MHTHKQHQTKNKTIQLALMALGVVYGDIGTSPLYAINEIFFGHGEKVHTTAFTLGAISLVLWALTIIVSLKYIFFVLRADNEGEGGVFALYGLLNAIKTKSAMLIMSFLIIAAGFLFGDGIITPAISVISAVEGLGVATSACTPYIVPITIAILTGLFFIQSKGTAKVGGIFGPIVVTWFLSIAALGVVQLVHTPQIIASVNPLYALFFLRNTSIHDLFLVLGSVMLVVTGGEALYADMGHFGKLPIQIGWYAIVYPALILNYLGQGAYMLSGQAVAGNNIFYSMVPSWGLYPMVVLATLATIIASQALISGAFSLTQQAISLGLFPYVKIVHTHHEHEGQVYVPFINWTLYTGCIALVLIFQSSTRLASAYGLAVSGVMLITSLAMFEISRHYWKWNLWKTAILFVPLTFIDLTFLSANSLKFFEGGYIPLSIGIFLLIVMKTWQWGREHVLQTFNNYPSMKVKELIEIKKSSDACIPRTIVIMTPHPIINKIQSVPILKQMFWQRYGLLPEHLIFLTVAVQKVPYIHDHRFEVTELFHQKGKGSIISVKLNFGFMEEQNVEEKLHELETERNFHIDDTYEHWGIHVMHERIVNGIPHTARSYMQYALFKILQRNSETADQFFGLGKKQPLSVEIIPVQM